MNACVPSFRVSDLVSSSFECRFRVCVLSEVEILGVGGGIVWTELEDVFGVKTLFPCENQFAC